MCLSEVSLEVVSIDVSLGANVEWAGQSTILVDDFMHLAILLERRGEGVPVKTMATKARLVGKRFGTTFTRMRCGHTGEEA